MTIAAPAPDSARLSREFLPSDYHIDLDVDLEAGAFRGEVRVDGRLAAPSSSIRLHCLGLTIEQVLVTHADDPRPRPMEVHEEAAFETVRLVPATLPGDGSDEQNGAIPAGQISIRISYAGAISDGLLGFYRSTFLGEDGTTHTLACTQMEAPYARAVFPCCDEPSFKARFHVTLTVAEGLLAVSNSPEASRTAVGGGKVRIEFEPTMIMSTYLVAWVVGPLEASPVREVDGVPLRVIAPPGRLHLGDFALDTAEFALRWFGEYYGIPYPGAKVDLVAIPDFAFGAMENLGCVTFREVYLLTDPASATKSDLSRVAAVINHELAHMWFGDLVTMSWWNGIWLNEAFATFMELACTDAGHPEWDHWTDFGVERSAAFEIDALVNTRPIEIEVNTPDEADAMFDVLTYEKGASVLRMLEQYLGEDQFRAGVRQYLSTHAYANTETHDLWAALSEATGTPVTSMMNRWIFEGGHPRVVGSLSGSRLALTQQRNTAGGIPTAWTARPTPVRLGWIHEDGSRSTTSILLDSPTEVDRPEGAVAVTLNGDGVGFYRSALDEELHAALISRFGELSPLERFQYLDDCWAALLADAAPISMVLDAVWAAVADTDATVIRRASKAWSSVYRLAQGAERDTVADAIDRWVDRALEAAGGAYGGEVGAELFSLRGCYGTPDAELLAQARSLAGFHGEPTDDQELLSAAIAVLGTWADPSEFDWLTAQVDAAPTPQQSQRVLVALGRATDPDLYAQALDYFLHTARPQDGPYALRDAMLHPINGTIGWKFTNSHWQQVVERFPAGSLPRLLEGVRWLVDEASVHEVGEALSSRDFGGSETRIRQVLELQRAHSGLATRLAGELSNTINR